MSVATQPAVASGLIAAVLFNGVVGYRPDIAIDDLERLLRRFT
jgi:hypothetical protein